MENDTYTHYMSDDNQEDDEQFTIYYQEPSKELNPREWTEQFNKELIRVWRYLHRIRDEEGVLILDKLSFNNFCLMCHRNSTTFCPRFSEAKIIRDCGYPSDSD